MRGATAERVRNFIDGQQDSLISLLRCLVEAESPSSQPASHDRVRAILKKALADIGIRQIPIAMEVGSTDTIVEMLQSGRHVSFLPRFSVEEALEGKGLYHVRVQGLRIQRTLWIARTRSNLDNPVAEAFISLLREGAH